MREAPHTFESETERILEYVRQHGSINNNGVC